MLSDQFQKMTFLNYGETGEFRFQFSDRNLSPLAMIKKIKNNKITIFRCQRCLAQNANRVTPPRSNWKCLFLRRGENWSTPRKRRSRSKDENQQQTQPTYDGEYRESNPGHVGGSECSHHCAISTPPTVNFSGVQTSPFLSNVLLLLHVCLI